MFVALFQFAHFGVDISFVLKGNLSFVKWLQQEIMSKKLPNGKIVMGQNVPSSTNEEVKLNQRENLFF